MTIAEHTPTRVLVLGGCGFIGRHAVKALLQLNAEVTVGTRNPDDPDHKFLFQASTQPGKPLVENLPVPEESGKASPQNYKFRKVCLEDMQQPESWSALLSEVDVVLNCVGILRPVGAATYDVVHHLAPLSLVQACEVQHKRVVHVSALGLKVPASSGFLTSKQAGEAAIKKLHANWIIVRPSLLDGEGGYGAAWLRGVSKLPLFVAPADALGKIAAFMVEDLGEALARLCLESDNKLRLETSRVFELGGNSPVNFEAYIRGLRRRYKTSEALCIKIPGFLARLGAHICDLFYITPFSFGHWELLRRDNTPAPNRLPELLGREPAPVVSPVQPK